MTTGQKMFHAGDSLEDHCRVCKAVRSHTVIVADSEGMALRVICDYCGSQHNYRGGETRTASPRPPAGPAPLLAPEPVAERERRFPVAELGEKGGPVDLEMMLRRIIREETGLTPVAMAEKWHGGDLVLRPGKRDLQEKGWPIETFFHKVVMLRNRLRVLEQQINASNLPEDEKIRLQAYITGCYGPDELQRPVLG